MLIGYARVSTPDQFLNMQTEVLKSIGCEQIFTDISSGAKATSPGLYEAISHLRAKDTLVVWKLDCLGRSLAHLIQVIKDLNAKNIGFKSLQENIDTLTAGGQLIFHIFGALAEFEKELIKERTQAGLKAAKSRGRLGGRPNFLTEKQIIKLQQHYANNDLSVVEMCKLFNISKPTLYRYVKINKNG